MDFIQETKEKAKAARQFFKRMSKPVASLAVVGIAASFLPSCATSGANTFGSFGATRQGMSVTQTTISADGRTRTTTRQYQEFDMNDQARAIRNYANAGSSVARAARDLRRAFD